MQAGEGEDGRLKSAIGIGSLLMDGLGDTIRVSLTEDPEFELEPCRSLAQTPSPCICSIDSSSIDVYNADQQERICRGREQRIQLRAFNICSKHSHSITADNADLQEATCRA